MVRLDLNRVHCSVLTIRGHADLSEEAVEGIFGGSYIYEQEREEPVVYYGSSYTIKGASYGASGRVWRVNNDLHHFEVSYISGVEARPPKSLKPVSTLVGKLNEYLGTISLECLANFRYFRRDSVVSRIPLPITYLLGSDSMFTDVEGISLGRREEGELRYSVDVSRSLTGLTLRHTVTVVLNCPFDNSVPRRVLREASRLSKALVVPKPEEHDGTG